MDKEILWRHSAAAVRRVCDLLGGPSNLAAELEVAPATVSGWLRGDPSHPAARLIPFDKAIDSAALVNGQVAAEEMRPDKAESIAHLRELPKAPPPATPYIGSSSAPSGASKRPRRRD